MKKMQQSKQKAYATNKGTIIIADDDKSIRTILNQALLRAGYKTLVADNAQTLWQWVSSQEGDLIITDVVFPEQNIFDFIPRIKELRPSLPVIVVSAQNTFMTAIKASESGAYDYLAKPFDLTELMNIVSRALAEKSLSINTKDEILTDSIPLIGRSSVMQDVYRTLARLVQTDLTVMITGESGTGKELIARALHDYSKRKDKPFIAINMAAIPRDLIESELFGHEKGSFTGANARSTGRFEQANHGTLFLDEIGDMPLEAQTRLLRVLQQGEYMSVGGNTPIKTNVRIVAATNKNLQNLIQQGLFRDDLFYRLNVVPLQLPPLRERIDDIDDLILHFLQKAAKEDNLSQKKLTQDAIKCLKQYSWPGNVRELENMARRLTALYPQEHINADVINIELNSSKNIIAHTNDIYDKITIEKTVELFLHQLFSSPTPNHIPKDLYYYLLNKIEPPLIKACLQAAQGNQIKAADILGLNRNTLRKKIKELGINIYENE